MPWLISCLSNPLDGRDRRTSRRRSCLNIAVGMARFGGDGGVLWRGHLDRSFGRMIADQHACRRSTFATRRAVTSDDARVVRHIGGEPQYVFYDEATAFPKLGLSGTARSPSTRSKRSMSGRPHSPRQRGSSGACDDRSAGRITTISFDPNCRPNSRQT